MKIEKAFGYALKQKRLEIGLTQEKLAEKSGISTRYISKLECAGQLPNFKYIQAISTSLGLKPSQFLEEVEKAQEIQQT